MEDLFELKQLIQEPTRVTLNTSSTIDLILTSMPEKHVKSGVTKITLSDHYMVNTTLKIQSESKLHREITFRDYKNFDVDKFVSGLYNSKIFREVMFSGDVNDAWIMWRNEMLRLSNVYAPIKTMRLKNRRNPWVNKEIIKMMYARDKLHEKAVLTGDSAMWA